MSAIGPGDFVECVDDSARGALNDWELGAAIYRGRIYTVTAVFIDCCDDESLELKEVQRGREAYEAFGGRVGYVTDRFRPIYRRDESLTTRLLENMPAKAPELEPA